MDRFGRSKDSRTLLKTPKPIGEEIQSIAGGEFWYKGIENNLVNYLKLTVPSIDELSIQVSTDGLPLHRGGPTQLWPILMNIVELPSAPIMMSAVFCGPAKPTSLEVFLRQFVEEANDIHRRGLRIGDKMIKFSIQAIIADSPARAFLKATTYFNGYHGCMRCTCVGEYYKHEKKIFSTPLALLYERTMDLNLGIVREWRSPLEDLDDFVMVDKLPTSCGLHLCYEGATRRHLCGLVGGKYENIPTWSKGQKQAISEFLISVQLPFEIHRKLRGLNVIRYWKGTEFRSYLLYVSPVLMDDVLAEKAYCHFLLYFCGVAIFSSSFHRRHWERAAEFLNSFVKDYGKIYGRGELTSNVHNIQHIARDCFNY
uniref:Transposase domain-containing protein n=1 Tax=Anopheles arabiensis TaxID=7173 RepID=A0A182ICL9_ANOAR